MKFSGEVLAKFACSRGLTATLQPYHHNNSGPVGCHSKRAVCFSHEIYKLLRGNFDEMVACTHLIRRPPLPALGQRFGLWLFPGPGDKFLCDSKFNVGFKQALRISEIASLIFSSSNVALPENFSRACLNPLLRISNIKPLQGRRLSSYGSKVKLSPFREEMVKDTSI